MKLMQFEIYSKIASEILFKLLKSAEAIQIIMNWTEMNCMWLIVSLISPTLKD